VAIKPNVGLSPSDGQLPRERDRSRGDMRRMSTRQFRRVDSFGDRLAEDFFEHEKTPNQDSTNDVMISIPVVVHQGPPDRHTGCHGFDRRPVGAPQHLLLKCPRPKRLDRAPACSRQVADAGCRTKEHLPCDGVVSYKRAVCGGFYARQACLTGSLRAGEDRSRQHPPCARPAGPGQPSRRETREWFPVTSIPALRAEEQGSQGQAHKHQDHRSQIMPAS